MAHLAVDVQSLVCGQLGYPLSQAAKWVVDSPFDAASGNFSRLDSKTQTTAVSMLHTVIMLSLPMRTQCVIGESLTVTVVLPHFRYPA